jgi:Xaa-Pro aminopeptidase
LPSSTQDRNCGLSLLVSRNSVFLITDFRYQALAEAVAKERGIDNYCSDITRMLYFGTPTTTFKKIYAIVLKAQMNAINNVTPGMRMCDIDLLARSIIDKAGYGEYFAHGLGHGLGMAGAEFYGARPGDTTKAEPGMTFTIEPGIYIPAWGGIRIEDNILVTEDNIEVLTSLPK